MWIPPVEQDDAAVASALESILLAAGGPVSIAELAAACGVAPERVRRVALELVGQQTGGIRMQISAEAAQLVTAPENIEAVHRFLGTSKPPALGRSTLETLAVVAYRQPVTRSEIESLRGVNSDRAVQVLVARGLIEEQGVRQTLGRPTEYGTTWAFLEYFGLSSLEELPILPGNDQLKVNPSDLGLRGSGEMSE